MLKKFVLFILSLMAIFCLFCLLDPSFQTLSWFLQKKCAECSERVDSSFISFQSKNYHSYHFYCHYCSQVISASYEEEANAPYHPICLKKKHDIRCSYCQQALQNHYREEAEKIYHPECWEEIQKTACDYCQKNLTGKYFIFERKKYHQSCFVEHIAPRCAVCEEALLEGYLTNYWYAFHKFHQDLPECSNCHRLIVPNVTQGGKEYSDQRPICNLCFSQAVTTEEQVEQIYQEIQKQMVDFGLSIKTQNLPIHLVFQPELKKRAKFIYTPRLQGLTESQVWITGEKKQYQFTISILYGLEENLFRSVLIHELGHVWTKENRESPLPREIEEGFANYLSLRLLETRKNEMSQYFQHLLKINPDPVYGEGFRTVNKYIQQWGWSFFLKKIIDPKFFQSF